MRGAGAWWAVAALACGSVEPVGSTTSVSISGSGLGTASGPYGEVSGQRFTEADTDVFTDADTDQQPTTGGLPPASTSTSSSGGATSTGSCAIGMQGCACTNGGGCDEGLMCRDEVCVPADPCPAKMIGAEGCQCTMGGGCDPGLDCVSMICVDPS